MLFSIRINALWRLLINFACLSASLTFSSLERVVEPSSKALKDGDRVELRGFGTFTTKLRNARIGRNPKTGDPVAIPQKKMPFFKMGKSMKERINS